MLAQTKIKPTLKHKILITFIIIASLSFLFFMLFLVVNTQVSNPPLMRIGTNVWPGYEPLYMAVHKNTNSDVDFKMVEFQSTTEVMRTFQTHNLEAAAVTLDEAIMLARDSINFKIVLVLDISDGGDALIGNPKFINKLADLKGRTIGVEDSAAGGYFLSRVIEKAGLKPEDIKIIYLDPNRHYNAYMEGTVEGVITFEPYKSKILDQDANLVFDSSQIPNEIFDVLIVQNEFLEQNPEAVALLKRYWFDVIKDIKNNQDSPFLAMMAAREQISKLEFNLALRGLKFPEVAENAKLMSFADDSLLEASRKILSYLKSKRNINREIKIENIFK